HSDHAEAVPAIRERYPGAPLAAARGHVDVLLQDGSTFGPLVAVLTPGHAPDHLSFLAGDVAFTGDAVLGEGSVFISPSPGALVEYLAGHDRLRTLSLRYLCPGHGPLVNDPETKINDYISHPLERETRLLAALDRGARSVDELLDDAWADAPPRLRPAASWTLAAHLDKLDREGRLPSGVERRAGRPPTG